MIKSTQELMLEYASYSNRKMKIQRLVRQGILFPVVKGIYETDRSTDPMLLAGVICGPSYISFQSALSYYGLIPEAVPVITSATTLKNRRKTYDTAFGTYTYRDVPSPVFPYELNDLSVSGYPCLMASEEKCVCDTLYTLSPVGSIRALKELLFDDLRINEEALSSLRIPTLLELSEKYNTGNHRLFAKLLRKEF